MIVMVTGSRTWDDFAFIWSELNALYFSIGPRMILMHGHCGKGADEAADQWGLRGRVPTIRWPANWARDGRAAGVMRNMAMVDSGIGYCLAFLRDASRGTSQCVAYARSKGVRTVVFDWEDR